MQTYCVSCRKYTGNKDAKMIKSKNGRLQMKSLCSVCEKKSRFVKEQEAKGILSSLGIRTLLPKIPGVNIFFNYKTCKLIVWFVKKLLIMLIQEL